MQVGAGDPARVVRRAERTLARAGSPELRRVGKQSLLPPSADPDILYQLTPEQLLHRYPVRYEMFRRVRAAMRNEQQEPSKRNPAHELPPEHDRLLMLKWLRMIY